MRTITVDMDAIERRVFAASPAPAKRIRAAEKALKFAALYGMNVDRPLRESADGLFWSRAPRHVRYSLLERLLSFLFPPRLPMLPVGYAVGEAENVRESG